MAKDKSEKKDKKRKEIERNDETAGALDVEMVDADGPKVLNVIYHILILDWPSCSPRRRLGRKRMRLSSIQGTCLL